MERGVKRDARKFLLYRWRLIECPYTNPANLVRVWRDRFGFLPPFATGAIEGWHFLLRDGGRAVVFVRPQRLQIPESVRAQLFAVLAAKHRVADIRLTEAPEKLKLKEVDRIASAADLAVVEEWPGSLP